MLKRILFTFLALFFPWTIMLIDDNPGGALLALLMQATLIGWPPATLWALRVRKEWRIAAKQKNN